MFLRLFWSIDSSPEPDLKLGATYVPQVRTHLTETRGQYSKTFIIKKQILPSNTDICC